MIHIIGQIILFILMLILTCIIFVDSFLWHELMHIKSQGLLATGRKAVNKYGMTVGCNDTHDNKLFRYGGGLLGCIPMFLLVFFTSGWIQWCFLTMGYVQLIYGLYEGSSYPIGKRFYIYVGVITFMILLWFILNVWRM